MSNYLIIESRDPFELTDVGQLFSLARDLSQEGNKVTVYLIQNGVLAARQGARTNGFQALLDGEKVTVLADDFSLTERGIQDGEIGSGIKVSNMDNLVDLMMDDGPKVIWH